MAKRGGKPNLERRERAAALRSRGLTLSAIGEQMDCKPQAAAHLIRRHTGENLARPLCCRQCKGVIAEPKQGVWTNSKPLCLTCLAHMPTAPFGQRLQAFRLARGLSQRALAEAVGIGQGVTEHHERAKRSRIDWDVLRKLVGFFGPGLVWLEPSAKQYGKGSERKERRR